MIPVSHITADRLVVVDVETTGVNPFRHQILSLALVPIDSSKPSLEIYVRCGELVWQNRALEYFSQYQSIWEAESISPHLACDQIKTYLSTHFDTPVTLVGHNVGFDVAFLRQLAYRAELDELPLVSHRAVDTHTLLFLLHSWGRIPDQALSSSGAFAHFGISIPRNERHSAIGDAVATRELFLRVMSMLLTTSIGRYEGQAIMR